LITCLDPEVPVEAGYTPGASRLLPSVQEGNRLSPGDEGFREIHDFYNKNQSKHSEIWLEAGTL
jgi:hypothetical protein